MSSDHPIPPDVQPTRETNADSVKAARMDSRQIQVRAYEWAYRDGSTEVGAFLKIRAGYFFIPQDQLRDAADAIHDIADSLENEVNNQKCLTRTLTNSSPSNNPRKS